MSALQRAPAASRRTTNVLSLIRLLRHLQPCRVMQTRARRIRQLATIDNRTPVFTATAFQAGRATDAKMTLMSAQVIRAPTGRVEMATVCTSARAMRAGVAMTATK